MLIRVTCVKIENFNVCLHALAECMPIYIVFYLIKLTVAPKVTTNCLLCSVHFKLFCQYATNLFLQDKIDNKMKSGKYKNRQQRKITVVEMYGHRQA